MIEVKTLKDTKQYNISTRLLMAEALRKGYEVSFYPSAPSTESGVTRATKKGREVYFKSTCTVLTPSYGYFAAEDKVLTYSLLSTRGINTPVTRPLGFHDPVEELFPMLRQYGSIVVKPANMNHGDGVTINVDTKAKLRKAVAYARAAGEKETDVIAQQQVTGQEYRFLVVDGKVIAVAGRRPAFVTGDGHSTIEELIKIKNEDPRRGVGHVSELTLLDVDEVIQHRGQKFLHTIPQMGEDIDVLDTSNLSKGGESIDVTDIASREIKKLAVDAAEACFLGIAGVDIMTKDITAETADDSFVIEVNLTPGIRMHQFPSNGKGRDVAKQIFRSIEKHSRPIEKKLIKIGRAEEVVLKGMLDAKLPARIDSGATLSSVWATHIKEKDGKLTFRLLGHKSRFYTGETITVTNYGQRAVSTSTGEVQLRYQIKIPVKLKGKVVTARFTLADRSTQVYPVLIGRNVLRNNFLVDVFSGKKDLIAERRKRAELDRIKKKGV